MKPATSLALLILLAASAYASPAIVSRDSTGVVVNSETARHYARLCEQYPSFGDKVGDGVIVLDTDQFHIDSQHFADYQKMVALETEGKTDSRSNAIESPKNGVAQSR